MRASFMSEQLTKRKIFSNKISREERGDSCLQHFVSSTVFGFVKEGDFLPLVPYLYIDSENSRHIPPNSPA
jgi:hypothetical protein